MWGSRRQNKIKTALSPTYSFWMLGRGATRHERKKSAPGILKFRCPLAASTWSYLGRNLPLADNREVLIRKPWLKLVSMVCDIAFHTTCQSMGSLFNLLDGNRSQAANQTQTSHSQITAKFRSADSKP